LFQAIYIPKISKAGVLEALLLEKYPYFDIFFIQAPLFNHQLGAVLDQLITTITELLSEAWKTIPFELSLTDPS